MTGAKPIRPVWHVRDSPLAAAAVVASGDALPRLKRSTYARVQIGARLIVAADHGYLLVIGNEADLPWSDGAVYLGWEAGVLVPTTSRPIPSTALIVDAARRAAADNDLVVVLPGAVLHVSNRAPITDPAQLSDLLV